MANIHLQANRNIQSHLIITDENFIQNAATKNNPNISNFKSVLKKHTNFSIDIHPHAFKNNHNKPFGQSFICDIHKYGDLLYKLYLEVDIEIGSLIPTYTINHFMNSLIKKSQIRIGSEIIEENISQWIQIKSELLNKSYSKQVKSCDTGGGNPVDLNFTHDLNRTEYDINDIDKSTLPLIVGGNINDSAIEPDHVTQTTKFFKKKFLYEFDFWFTRNIGQAFPLDKLGNYDLQLIFNVETEDNLIGDSKNINYFKISSINLYSQQIYLDNAEKIYFKNKETIEYVIDKVTHTIFTTPKRQDSNTLHPLYKELSFKYPTKCLIWAIQNTGIPKQNKGQGPCYFASMTNTSLYGSDGTHGSFNISLNGYKLIQKELPMIFFTRKTPKLVCNNIPPLDRIGIYSFALKPFELDVSGHCNFERIRQKTVNITLSNNNIELIETKPLYIFALTYNVLTLSNNYIGLLYKN